MRSPSLDCSTTSAFWRGRRKRINTESTEAGAPSTQRVAEIPVDTSAVAVRFAGAFALLLASTIFLGAFLLCLLEPLFAKLILPRFGGSAAVWATCLVFFQCALLLGYVYADFTTRRLTAARQSILHIWLLLLSLAFLPLAPHPIFRSSEGNHPAAHIISVLAASIGLPFVLLSATSPLVQAWHARAKAGSEPYHLFALSNFASLLALLSFPFLIEPRFSSHQQSLLWSALFVIFAGVCAVTAWLARRTPPPHIV